MAASEHKAPALVTFSGVLFLLIGIFISVRTLLSLFLLPKYPTVEIVSLSGILGFASFYQEEEGCINPYPMEVDVSTGVPTVENQKRQEEICLNDVKRARNQAKLSDISASIFFLFMGAGVLATRKTFFPSRG